MRLHRRQRSVARRLTRVGLEPPQPGPVIDRFLTHVERDEQPDGHWHWRGYRNRWGTPVFRLWSGPTLATRVSVVLFARPCLNEGETLRRTCSETDCVAPSHFEIKRPHGACRLKITPTIARAIRTDVARGVRPGELVARYGLSPRHLQRVVRGEYPRAVAA